MLNKQLHRLLAIIVLISVSFVQLAQGQSLVDQRVIFSAANDNTDYLLSLSALKKIDAVTVSDREFRLRGNVLRNTYEFDLGLTQREAWGMVENEFTSDDYDLLFSCSALSCGRSNYWANDRFGIKQLYGLDQSQRYRVYKYSGASPGYRVVYFVQRGNKKMYAQIDSITVEQLSRITPSYTAIFDTLQQKGFFIVYVEDNDQPDNELIDAVILMMRKNALQKYYLVGHSYVDRTQEGNAKQGLLVAERIHEILLEKGAPANRLMLESVGALVPRGPLGLNRVELVLR